MADTLISDTEADYPAEPTLWERADLAKVIGVMGMAMGIAGLTCLPFRILWEAAPPRPEGLGPVGYKEAIFPILGLLLSILLIAGSYALFQLHRHARPLLLLYAVCSLLAGVGSLVFYAWEIRRYRQGLLERGGGVAFTFELVMWPLAMAFSIYLLNTMTWGKLRRTLLIFNDNPAITPPTEA
jgi:hypothetical protein